MLPFGGHARYPLYVVPLPRDVGRRESLGRENLGHAAKYGVGLPAYVEREIGLQLARYDLAAVYHGVVFVPNDLRRLREHGRLGREAAAQRLLGYEPDERTLRAESLGAYSASRVAPSDMIVVIGRISEKYDSQYRPSVRCGAVSQLGRGAI